MGGVLMYALVKNATIVETRGSLPSHADLNGNWVAVTVENAAACGWLTVTDVERPASTASDWTRTVTLVVGVPTMTWTARPWTQAELDSQAADANRSAIETYLSTAKATLDTIIGRPAVSLTQADLRQVQQDCKDVARVVERLRRLGVRQFDATS
jgi:hypothetical protein